VHVQAHALFRCLFDINLHICHTLAAGCAHMCICIYIYVCACICIWKRMCVYDLARGVELLLTRFIIGILVCIYRHMYMCVHVYVYVCMCHGICMNMYICVSVYIYAYTCIFTRVWVYKCPHVGAFLLFVLSNLSTTCVCITGVFLTPSCVCRRGLEVGFFPTCPCHG